MPSLHVRKLGPERVRVPQPRGTVLLIRAIPIAFAVAMLGCLFTRTPRTGGVSGAEWLLLFQFVTMIAATRWASNRPLLAIHERGIVVGHGRSIHTLRWDEARVDFATSMAGRLLIRPVGGPAARSIISIDIPPGLVEAVARALPNHDAPTLITDPREAR
ncbi:hypothetical protein TA3x_001830 [Tundrisphaera sp. TA3]|uniref:hypothetical protein n=1 Tax=Tundrisphaera sp. TA3 TaxID=3435775 RepID=UPI003EBB40D8